MKSLLYCSLLALIIVSCSPNNVKEDNSLGNFFKDAKSEGCFALFDNATGNFTVYNLERYRDSTYSPGSSFNLVTALVGLQTGIIPNDSMVVKSDSAHQEVPEWNGDLSMYRAFRVSSVPYFQEIARRIGNDTMQFWVDSLAYGNKLIKGSVDSFYLNNTIKLTPDEQLGLVKRLYFNQLPFYRLNQEIVKRAMLMEDRPEYKLSYVVGDGRKADGTPLSWVTGYIEENNHPYLFVLNMESKDPTANLRTARIPIVKGILDKLGFMKGVK